MLLDTATWDPTDGRPGSAEAVGERVAERGVDASPSRRRARPPTACGRRCDRSGDRRPARPPHARTAAVRTAARVPWGAAASSGVATLLASAPLGAIIQGYTWLGYAAVAALVVVGARVGAAPAGPGRRRRRPVRGPARRCSPPSSPTTPCSRGSRRLRRVRRAVRRRGHADRRGHRPGAAPRRRSSSWSPSAFGAVAGRGVLRRRARRAPPPRQGCPLLAVFAVPAALDDALLPWQPWSARPRASACCSCCATGARSQRIGRDRPGRGCGGVALGVGSVERVRRHRGPVRGRGRGRGRRDRAQPVHLAARAAHAGAARPTCSRCAACPSPPTCAR